MDSPQGPDPGTCTKPTIVGIYGLPGSGKTHLLQHLSIDLLAEGFEFFEGSEVVASLTQGGLVAFKGLVPMQQDKIRIAAINEIKSRCTVNDQVGVVTGHFMFWTNENTIATDGDRVFTQSDAETYTHILYMDTDPGVIAQRTVQDREARPDRRAFSREHLFKWQQTEKLELSSLCRQHGIRFETISSGSSTQSQVRQLLLELRFPFIVSELNSHVNRQNQASALETVLLFDADKTLAPTDTGALFWEHTRAKLHLSAMESVPLGVVFNNGYSYSAFRQAASLYEDVRKASDIQYDALCADVAACVIMHPEFVTLLGHVVNTLHVTAVVLTSGLAAVWQHVLKKHGLESSVTVIGTSASSIVTPAAKAMAVSHLRSYHSLYVWAFGDSPIDIPMLRAADRAVVVVGRSDERSKSMEQALLTAVEAGLRAQQALLPGEGPARLDTTRLPTVDVSATAFLNQITKHRRLLVFHATEKSAAKLLASRTRDAAVSGPDLRQAHHEVGKYLALEYVSGILGLEEYQMAHVTGGETTGHCFKDEAQIAIVALMRGGEPMASGVNAAMPRAAFFHDCPPKLDAVMIRTRSAIIIVDSVVNTGKSLVPVVQHFRNAAPDIRLVIVVGVVQAGAVAKGSILEQLAREGEITLVALRLSENKFKGIGGTDTGNRLFNTTWLE